MYRMQAELAMIEAVQEEQDRRRWEMEAFLEMHAQLRYTRRGCPHLRTRAWANQYGSGRKCSACGANL
jgi:hypothetical protein